MATRKIGKVNARDVKRLDDWEEMKVLRFLYYLYLPDG